MISRRLVWEYLRHRSRTAVGLVVLCALLVSIFTGLAVVRSSVGQAVEESIRSQAAGFPYLVTSSDPAATAAVQEAGGIGLAESEQHLWAGEAGTSAIVQATAYPGLPLGVLTSGRHPEQIDEAVLSLALATELNVDLGQHVTMGDAPESGLALRVVGITDDPASPQARALVHLTPEAETNATTWLMEHPPYEVVALEPHFSAGSLHMRTVHLLAQESAGDVVRTLIPGGAALPWVVVGVLGLLLMVVCIVLMPTAQRDSESLIAAGMPAGPARRVLLRAFGYVVIVGVCLGAGLAVLCLTLLREGVSGVLGQRWAAIQVPWLMLPVPFLLALVIPLLVLAGRWLFTQSRWVAAFQHRSVPVALWWVMLGAGLLIYALASMGWLGLGSLIVGMALVVLGSAPVIVRALSRRLPPVTAHFARRISAPLAVVGVALSVMVGAGTVFAATEIKAISYLEQVSHASQPAGSLVADGVPEMMARQLVLTWRTTPGVQASYLLWPDESRDHTRATSAGIIDCLRRGMTLDEATDTHECLPGFDGLVVAPVALHAEPGKAAVAAPLLRADDGTVEVLQFTAGADDPDESVEHRGTIPTQSDQSLGGVLPALVLDPDSELAQTLGLRSSGASVLLIPGFSELSAPEQAHLRGSLLRAAPAALLNEADALYDQDRAIAQVVLLVVTVLAGALMLLAGHVMDLVGQRDHAVLADLGAPNDLRRAVLLVGPATAGALLVLAALLAWIPTLTLFPWEITRMPGVSAGLGWVAPPLAGIAALAVLSWKVLPRRG